MDTENKSPEGKKLPEIPEELKVRLFRGRPVKEFAQMAADPAEKPAIAGVSAAVGALAAAMGSLALAVSAPAEEKVIQSGAEELRQMREYMLAQIDELIRAEEALDMMQKKGETRTEHLESAARIACSGPNEIVFVMGRNIELLDRVADVCGDAAVPFLLTALHLTIAVIRCMQVQIKVLTRYMLDPVYARTVVREAELDWEGHAAMAEALSGKLEQRL